MAQTERTERTELMVRQVRKDQPDQPEQLAHKDRQVLPEPLALAFQLEEQLDNCLQKHLRQIMILPGA